ncbi:MAG: hypothetical protein ABI383_03410 [Acidobacteriaceae bacterium]
MKKIIAMSVMALTISALSAFAVAQEDQSAASNQPASTQTETMNGHRGHRGGARMAQELGLTPDQQSQMKQHHEQQMESMKALKADTSLTPEQKHDKMKEAHAQNQQFMDNLLTPEQKTKWEQMKQQHHIHEHGPQTAAQPQG